MSGRLPDLIEPFQLVERKAVLEGSYAADSLPRVADLLAGPAGDLAVRLEFGRDDDGRAVITGRIDGAVPLRCQRCLEPVTVALAIRPRLGLCGTEAEAERLPEVLDPLVSDGRPLAVRGIVEDEVLLALPIVARHPEGCATVPRAKGEGPGGVQHPFKDLKKLLGGEE